MPSDQVRDVRKPVSPWFPRGVTLLHDPALNKGIAFGDAERDRLKGLAAQRAGIPPDEGAVDAVFPPPDPAAFGRPVAP